MPRVVHPDWASLVPVKAENEGTWICAFPKHEGDGCEKDDQCVIATVDTRQGDKKEVVITSIDLTMQGAKYGQVPWVNTYSFNFVSQDGIDHAVLV